MNRTNNPPDAMQLNAPNFGYALVVRTVGDRYVRGVFRTDGTCLDQRLLEGSLSVTQSAAKGVLDSLRLLSDPSDKNLFKMLEPGGWTRRLPAKRRNQAAALRGDALVANVTGELVAQAREGAANALQAEWSPVKPLGDGRYLVSTVEWEHGRFRVKDRRTVTVDELAALLEELRASQGHSTGTGVYVV